MKVNKLGLPKVSKERPNGDLSGLTYRHISQLPSFAYLRRKLSNTKVNDIRRNVSLRILCV